MSDEIKIVTGRDSKLQAEIADLRSKLAASEQRCNFLADQLQLSAYTAKDVLELSAAAMAQKESAAEIERLNARVIELEADKARLDWMESRAVIVGEEILGITISWTDTLRRKIDAAMRQK